MKRASIILLTVLAAAAFNAFALTVPDEQNSGLVSNTVRLSFNDAPLNTVLNYLSDMYGFVITGETSIRGNINVIANTPVNFTDAIELLNSELIRQGYQAVLTGSRMLTIMKLEDAKRCCGTPVINSSNPDTIPVNGTVVTQIIPVQSLNPTQLVKDLQPLFPDRDTLTANEAGNALIMTAPQSDVHRIAEIVKALDSASVSDVKVFLLRFADSKSVASELKDIFADPNAQQNSARNFTRLRFGNQGDGGNSNGSSRGGTGGDGTSSSPIHVNAVSDDQNNAVLVSAPSGLMDKVSELIGRLDLPSEDVTAIRVFQLRHADPTETADELTSLFSDTASSSGTADRGMGFNFVGNGGGNTVQQSDRMKRKSKVLAVADRRGDSIIVTASKDLMAQIEKMIDELDKSNAHQDYLVTIPLNYADASEVQTMMQDLFQGAAARASSSSAANSALLARETQNAQQQSTSSSSSLGTGSGLGAAGQR